MWLVFSTPFGILYLYLLIIPFLYPLVYRRFGKNATPIVTEEIPEKYTPCQTCLSELLNK